MILDIRTHARQPLRWLQLAKAQWHEREAEALRELRDSIIREIVKIDGAISENERKAVAARMKAAT